MRPVQAAKAGRSIQKTRNMSRARLQQGQAPAGPGSSRARLQQGQAPVVPPAPETRMSRTVRDLVTINHLPGLLLASMPECERWIAAGLIPVAEQRTFRGWGQTREAPMFDPK